MSDRSGLSEAAAQDVAVVARGGALQIGGQITSRSLSFAFGAVALRLIGTAGFGFYRQIAQVLAIAGQLGLAGFNYAAMRFIARARASGEHGGVRGAATVGLWGAATASLLVTLVIVAGAGEMAGAFADRPRDAGAFAALLRFGAPYVPLFALMQVLRYCTQAYKTMGPSVLVGTIIQPAARYILGLAALVAGLHVAGIIGGMVAGTAIGAVAGAYFYGRILTDDERRAPAVYQPGPMIRFALPQAGASLLSVQDLGYGVIVLGLVAGDADVGLFAAALALQGPGSLFLSGIVNIWAPVVTDLHSKGEIERLGALFKTINRWVATFALPVFVALILEGDLFARIYGAIDDPSAGTVVAILALGNIVYTATGPTGYLLSMSGYPQVNLINSIAAVGAYVGMGFLIVPRYGVVGMAAVDAIVTAAVNVARVVECKILIGVQPFGRSFLKPIFATLVGGGVLLSWRLIPGDALWLQVAGVAVSAIAYVGVLRALGIDPEERYVIDRVRGRLKRMRKGAER